jgi:hypothetical protein
LIFMPSMQTFAYQRQTSSYAGRDAAVVSPPNHNPKSVDPPHSLVPGPLAVLRQLLD